MKIINKLFTLAVLAAGFVFFGCSNDLVESEKKSESGSLTVSFNSIARTAFPNQTRDRIGIELKAIQINIKKNARFSGDDYAADQIFKIEENGLNNFSQTFPLPIGIYTVKVDGFASYSESGVLADLYLTWEDKNVVVKDGTTTVNAALSYVLNSEQSQAAEGYFDLELFGVKKYVADFSPDASADSVLSAKLVGEGNESNEIILSGKDIFVNNAYVNTKFSRKVGSNTDVAIPSGYYKLEVSYNDNVDEPEAEKKLMLTESHILIGNGLRTSLSANCTGIVSKTNIYYATNNIVENEKITGRQDSAPNNLTRILESINAESRTSDMNYAIYMVGKELPVINTAAFSGSGDCKTVIDFYGNDGLYCSWNYDADGNKPYITFVDSVYNNASEQIKFIVKNTSDYANSFITVKSKNVVFYADKFEFYNADNNTAVRCAVDKSVVTSGNDSVYTYACYVLPATDSMTEITDDSTQEVYATGVGERFGEGKNVKVTVPDEQNYIFYRCNEDESSNVDSIIPTDSEIALLSGNNYIYAVNRTENKYYRLRIENVRFSPIMINGKTSNYSAMSDDIGEDVKFNVTANISKKEAQLNFILIESDASITDDAPWGAATSWFNKNIGTYITGWANEIAATYYYNPDSLTTSEQEGCKNTFKFHTVKSKTASTLSDYNDGESNAVYYSASQEYSLDHSANCVVYVFYGELTATTKTYDSGKGSYAFTATKLASDNVVLFNNVTVGYDEKTYINVFKKSGVAENAQITDADTDRIICSINEGADTCTYNDTMKDYVLDRNGNLYVLWDGKTGVGGASNEYRVIKYQASETGVGTGINYILLDDPNAEPEKITYDATTHTLYILVKNSSTDKYLVYKYSGIDEDSLIPDTTEVPIENDCDIKSFKVYRGSCFVLYEKGGIKTFCTKFDANNVTVDVTESFANAGSMAGVNESDIEFSDFEVTDDYLYVLAKHKDFSGNSFNGPVSRGAILLFSYKAESINYEKMIGWQPYSSELKYYYADGRVAGTMTVYGPNNVQSKSLFGPVKILAITPKKLVIADNGEFFYSGSDYAYNEMCGDNVWIRHVNRIVTVDLSDYSTTVDAVMEKLNFRQKEMPGSGFFANKYLKSEE